MSQQCVNSFIDNLEDLIKDSEFSADNFTVNEESFRKLQLFANHAIHGKEGNTKLNIKTMQLSDSAKKLILVKYTVVAGNGTLGNIKRSLGTSYTFLTT